MNLLELAVTVMGCGGRVQHVRTALSAVPGVVVRDVAIGKAVVQIDPQQSSEAAVIRALAASGYPATKVADVSSAPAHNERKGGCCAI